MLYYYYGARIKLFNIHINIKRFYIFNSENVLISQNIIFDVDIIFIVLAIVIMIKNELKCVHCLKLII
jgi:hypothetical protein